MRARAAAEIVVDARSPAARPEVNVFPMQWLFCTCTAPIEPELVLRKQGVLVNEIEASIVLFQV